MLEKMRWFLNWRQGPWCVTAAVTVLAMVLGCLFDGAVIDMMTRYAPMAEAFAEGNWQEFFHPRFPLLFQLLAGLLVWATGLPGDLACILLSCFLWGMAIPGVFAVTMRLFERREVAWVAVLLYCICPMLLTWALFGLREPLRTLGTLWVVLAILSRKQGARSLATMLAGMLVLCTVRSDTLLPALFFGAVYAWFDRFRWRTWSVAAWSLLCVQPMCWVTYRWMGVWLPSSQWVAAFERLF